MRDAQQQMIKHVDSESNTAHLSAANGLAQFKLLSIDDLNRLPPPSWLIPEFVMARSLSVLYGPPGIGKSFLALDIALSVATNTGGIAKPNVSGPVVYIAGEGVSGLSKRIAAWEKERGCEARQIYFLPEAVNFMDEADVGKLVATVKMLPEPPCLIVIDTMARCSVGGEENSARDVGKFVAGVDAVRSVFGCAILILHHGSKHRAQTERGSSALRGAADSMLCLTGTFANLVLTCEKQKDAALFDPITLRLEAVELDDGEGSCVLQLQAKASAGLAVTGCHQALLDAMSGGRTYTYTVLKDAFLAATSRSKSTFDRSLADMVRDGAVVKLHSGEYQRVDVSGTKQGAGMFHDTS